MDRHAEDGDEDHQVIRPLAALDAGEDAEAYAQHQADRAGRKAQRAGDGKARGDHVVDRAVLVLKGDAEVSVQQVVHVGEVLLDLRLVQAVLGLHVRADFRQDHLFVGKRIARDGLHQDERRRQDDPQRQDGDQQTLDDVFDHGNLLSPFACKLLISNSRDSALSGPPERRRRPCG